MTKLDEFLTLYKSIGIDLKVGLPEERRGALGLNKWYRVIRFGAFEHPLFVGHAETHIVFDMDGNFVQQGFYEI